MNILRIMVCAALVFSSCGNDPLQPGGNAAPPYTQIDFDPVLSADGRLLAYVHSNINSDFTGLYRFDLLNGFNRQLINEVISNPDFSNSNSNPEIIFSWDNRLMKMNSDGQFLSQILQTGNNKNPKWNLIDNKILFENTDCSSGCGIRLTDSNGAFNNLIIQNGKSPEWTNTADEFIYLSPSESGKGDTLFKFNLTSGVKTFLKFLTIPEHMANQYLNYTVGEVILCSTSETGYSYIYKLNLNSGNIEKLSVNQGWSPYYSEVTGKIYYTNRNEGEGRIWIMNIDGSDNRMFDEIY
ncbi:MAG: hypothetical protein IPM38_00395 [Ignavibacteria bacterium]|nr:hypothetical protein [Ignavibacteria bacterium]